MFSWRIELLASWYKYVVYFITSRFESILAKKLLSFRNCTLIKSPSVLDLLILLHLVLYFLKDNSFFRRARIINVFVFTVIWVRLYNSYQMLMLSAIVLFFRCPHTPNKVHARIPLLKSVCYLQVEEGIASPPLNFRHCCVLQGQDPWTLRNLIYFFFEPF